MRKVRAKNTSPELTLRRLLCELGFRGYRIHYAELPGKPDVAFTRRKKAIFVHGCFWHGHDCRAGRNIPLTNQDYWNEKLTRNKERDQKHLEDIQELGWEILIIWECELKNREETAQRLKSFLCVSSI